jgi:hypothetical protein
LGSEGGPGPGPRRGLAVSPAAAAPSLRAVSANAVICRATGERTADELAMHQTNPGRERGSAMAITIRIPSPTTLYQRWLNIIEMRLPGAQAARQGQGRGSRSRRRALGAKLGKDARTDITEARAQASDTFGKLAESYIAKAIEPRRRPPTSGT